MLGVGVRACGSQGTACESCCPPFTTCIPGIRLGLLRLAANSFACEDVLAPHPQFTEFLFKVWLPELHSKMTATMHRRGQQVTVPCGDEMRHSSMEVCL